MNCMPALRQSKGVQMGPSHVRRGNQLTVNNAKPELIGAQPRHFYEGH